MNRFSALIVFAALAAGLAGCASVPDTIIQQPLTARPQAAPVPAPANGTIFQTSSYRPVFEDRRARLVGDTMVITIVERTSAGKSAGNSASKSGSVDYSAGALLGLPASTLAKVRAQAEGANTFDEKGASSSSNTFSGTIAVTVVDVLPNGNLLVSGEKQVAFDKGVEFVRFSGVVNPATVAAGNVVPSTQVADARIEYRTNSRLDKTEMMSQLTRFFFSLLPI
ncbi:flagellar basal body L-ring protein FlgH [Noviherbaspirillum cavernae]|uniref:Flagellar L-ring protein n=1 Tax=Noviherbaspirillum cavernae TaxID=2320862 RepID=A0A418X0C7_9BURK|nr:flagellar basal body L-ring protein FlgH [Noviherbaspirillum cavernae]RJG05940.1 flagellar basal body L-ring protein FlgH [Noviherbaspirillum cavernae]